MEIWQLFGGLIITLIIASSIGYGLKFKVGFSTPHAVIDNLNARINAWWVMILIIFAAAALGFYGVIGLFFVISFMALREFLSLLYIRRGDHLALAACFYVILPIQYIFSGDRLVQYVHHLHSGVWLPVFANPLRPVGRYGAFLRSFY